MSETERTIVVTTLNDQGPGSLRQAVEASGRRRIVFGVAGYIDLERPIIVTEPYVTIDGSTAPKRGICLRQNELRIRTHHVTVQYIRSRLGDQGLTINPDMGCCLNILLAKNEDDPERFPHDIVIDHCSFSWSQDTVVNVWNGKWRPMGDNTGTPQIQNVVISNCFMTEPLNNSLHSEPNHGLGLLIGAGCTNVVVHHCLFCHSHGRNPKANGGQVAIVNCVYDDTVANCLAGEQPEETGVPSLDLDFIGNLGKRVQNRLVLISPRSTDQEQPELQKAHRIYVKDNVGRFCTDVGQDSWLEVGWGWGAARGPADRRFQTDQMFVLPGLPERIDTPHAALASILDHGGCSRPVRDVVDERIAFDVLNETGKIIDSPSEVGGYPPLDDLDPPPVVPPVVPPPESSRLAEALAMLADGLATLRDAHEGTASSLIALRDAQVAAAHALIALGNVHQATAESLTRLQDAHEIAKTKIQECIDHLKG